ncbi:MAG: hypothetical protein COA74_02690 [Gammaproteobacteria bacterium]|nr:MAG: hypothetical protein COA74_02690 [Gammaproteobacteria bacterium]
MAYALRRRAMTKPPSPSKESPAGVGTALKLSVTIALSYPRAKKNKLIIERFIISPKYLVQKGYLKRKLNY